MPSVEAMMKKERMEDSPEKWFKSYSQQLNDLINLYFSVTNEDEIEIQVAGDEENRKLMMPVQYITSNRDKAAIEVSVHLLKPSL